MRSGLRRHASFVIAVSLLLTGLWLLSGSHFFWPLIPIVFLLLSLKAHRRHARYMHHHGYPYGRERVAPWNSPG